jgi:AraC family transcriptional regulator, regulatory protein of adaptative response / methylated-DNA-[protein]-cysteine methyltransferase
VLARDPSCDGAFVYAVITTGVYCRPTCPARRPKREHVVFYASATAAEAAGFRPCKRCTPNVAGGRARRAEIAAKACRLIEASEESLSLGELADRAALSPYHFHRLFKSVTGLTPKAYAKAVRNRRVRAQLTGSETVTKAIYESGFGSDTRFYAQTPDMLGMRPSAFRQGGADQTIRYAIGECSLGKIMVAASGKGVCAILFDADTKNLIRVLRTRFPQAALAPGDEDFSETVAKVIAFVEEPRGALDLPLDIRGTAFQQRVWEALMRIPPGETRSYAEIAQAVGAPEAARAVAGACAANKLAVAIPCHRVIRSDGSISGYRGGVARKRALLGKERKL